MMAKKAIASTEATVSKNQLIKEAKELRRIWKTTDNQLEKIEALVKLTDIYMVLLSEVNNDC